MTPNLTDAGKNLLLRALTGETINFTNIKIGNGPAQEAQGADGLVNPLLTVPISSITASDNYVTLTASFTNADVTSGFRITEVGFYAQDPDDSEKEILYALGNEEEGTADYLPDNTSRILEMEFSALLFIGEAENVTAIINSSMVYVSMAEFNEHTSDTKNPHNVTKEQVGLGNVPNVSTNAQRPTYTESAVLANLLSGEPLSTAFGKIKTVITHFIKHYNNRSNPHKVTASQVNAADKSHTHNASDINEGILSPLRGGTGVSSLGELAKAIGLNAVTGYYVGEGTSSKSLTFEKLPNLLVVMPISADADSPSHLVFLQGVQSAYSIGPNPGMVQVSWGETSISWGGTSLDYKDYCNYAGAQYVYFAIL